MPPAASNSADIWAVPRGTRGKRQEETVKATWGVTSVSGCKGGPLPAAFCFLLAATTTGRARPACTLVTGRTKGQDKVPEPRHQGLLALRPPATDAGAGPPFVVGWPCVSSWPPGDPNPLEARNTLSPAPQNPSAELSTRPPLHAHRDLGGRCYLPRSTAEHTQARGADALDLRSGGEANQAPLSIS